MNVSNSVFNVSLTIDRFFPGITVTIIGASFTQVGSFTTSNISLPLPRGLYHIQITARGYYQDEYIRVTKDESFWIEVKSYSSIPVLQYKSTHEYYSDYAQEKSKKCTHADTGEAPNFLFFCANYERNLPGSIPPSPQSFSLFQADDPSSIRFLDSNCYVNTQDGVVIFSGRFAPGLYFLEYEHEQAHRVLPIYIFKGFQTQFFVRFTTTPQFDTSRIFFTGDMQLDRSNKQYHMLERLLLAYSNFHYYADLDEAERSVISASPYLMALANILHHALDKPRPYASKDVLALPDLGFFEHPEERLDDRPPILACVLRMYINKSAEHILPASNLDRMIDDVRYDMFWSSCTRFKSPDKAVRLLESALYDNRTGLDYLMTRVNRVVDSLRPLAKSMTVVEESKGTTKTRTALYHKTAKFMNNYVMAKQMAEKFKLPPSAVIRNYKQLLKVYKQLQSTEKFMQAEFAKTFEAAD